MFSREKTVTDKDPIEHSDTAADRQPNPYAQPEKKGSIVTSILLVLLYLFLGALAIGVLLFVAVFVACLGA